MGLRLVDWASIWVKGFLGFWLIGLGMLRLLGLTD